MAVKINAVLSAASASSTFNENDLESYFYQLYLYFSAYALGYVDTTGYPSTYFKTLAEVTVMYFN